MSTTMLYNCNASCKVKPDVAHISITVVAKEETARKAVEVVNEKRELIKTYSSGRKSFVANSYHQQDISLNKRTNVIMYYHTDDPEFAESDISEKAYKELNEEDKLSYEQKYREELLYWEAKLHILLSLGCGDTVVEDLVNIFNLCTEKELRCDYNITISDALRKKTMQGLYACCISDGIEAVENIVAKVTEDCDEVNLLEIRDPAAKAMPAAPVFEASCLRESTAYRGASSYEPEKIIMPELVAELFNNDVELSKSLDLLFEF